MMKNLFKTSADFNRQTGKSYSSGFDTKDNSILFSLQNLMTMEKSYNLTRNSSSSKVSLFSGPSSFFKSFMLTLAIFVAGIGSLWGQNFSIVGAGTASNSTTTYPAPYGNYYYGARHQFLVTAAELSAAGLTAGSSISSLGFNVTTDNGAIIHSGFQVVVYSTALANPLATAYVTTGQVAASTASNYNPTTGWNQHSFTPFVWNGTSNFVIQTCFNNAAFTTNASTQWTTNLAGTTIKSRYRYADLTGICASTTTTATSTTTRPNIRFAWSPPLPTCPTLSLPANLATGVSLAPTLTWTAGANTSTYDVYLSANQTDVNNQAVGARVSTSQAGTSYNSATLSPSTTYYWRIVPKNSVGTAASGCTTRSFTTSAPSPTVSQSGTLSAFSACTNVASAQQSFSVSGLYLTGNLLVTAPTGFSVSTTSGSGWASSVSLTPSSGTVSSTTIYVSMNALASSPTAANIVCSSTSASSVNVAVSGTVNAAPTVNAGSDFNLCSGQIIALNGSTNATGATLSGSASSGTVTTSGTDNTNPTATYTFTGLPAGALINGITVNITSAGGGNCPAWYSVTTRLNGVQQGVAGCATNTTYTNLNGQAANGLVVAVRGQDNDAWADFMTITYTVTLNYTYVGPVNVVWSPATGLSATNVLNPNCSTTSTTTYTLTATSSNGCSASDQVVATVAGGAVPSTPTAAVSGASIINVGGTAILTSTAGANTVWYTAATGGTTVGTGSPFTSPVQCSSGTVTYYAEENNGTCSSNSRGAVSFTVRPMLVSNPANALICQAGGSVTLSTQLSGATGITWSPNTNLSTTSGASTVASPTTTTVYTMNATVAGCGSVSGTQTVGVIDAVAFTPTSTPASVCAGNTAALSSNLASSGFTYATTTFAMATPSSPTNLVANGATGVALASGNLDDGGWQNIPIGFTYNFFGNNYTTLNVGTNGVLQFGAYNATSLGDYTYLTAFPTVTEPTNIIAAAANDYYAFSGTIRYWTQGIAPTRIFVAEWNAVPGYTTNGSMTVQVKLFETTGNVEIHVQNASSTNNKVVGLQNASASIGATAYSNTATITNTAWKFIPGANYTFQWATAGSNIGGATATTYTTPVLSTPGTVSYSVAATNPNTQCTTTQSVNITVNSLPAAPVSLGDVTACNTAGSQNLVVSTGAGETADWYNASTAGTLLTNNNTTHATATAGTYFAEAENTTTGCKSATRTAVTLNTNNAPSAPTASGAAYCQGAAATALSASAPSGSNTQSWYTVAVGGTPLAGAPTPSTASAGTTNFYVSETSGSNGCESTRTLVSVTVNATPAAPSASNPSAYCQNATASALSATSDGSSTLYWYTVPTGGTGSTTAITPSTSSAGAATYYVSQLSASNCESSRTAITVTVNPEITASVTNSASSTSACGGNAITFTATPTNGGTPTYQWYLNGNPVGSNSATYTTNQASDNAGNYSGTWNNGSNQGLGMGAWAFNVNANTGQFIGNPSNDGNGTSGIGTTAHGIYATGSGYINTTRGFSTPMQIGDELRFYWIFNWDANGGNKGFDLRAGGSTIFNVNNSGSAAITVTGGATADGSYGTTPMYVQITRTSSTQYTFTMTRRSNGSTYSTTFNNTSALDAVSFYIGGQNDGSGQRNLYFNGLEMRPPQANDQIYVAMTPSAQTCLSSASATNSNTIALTSTASTPTVAIQSSASSAICPGTSVSFSVNSSSNMGASPTYQWNLNGTPISGATSATLVTTTLVNNDQVTLTMTSSLNAACLTQSSATSTAVSTTVNSVTAIATQPTSALACLGSSQNFTVAATGTGTLTYQWKKNGVNITGNATATSATLILSGIAAGDAADYTVVVTGTCGSVTSSVASLTINSATSILNQPIAVTQCAGTTANFSVTASGQGTLSYQWRKDGSALAGETNATLAVSNIAVANAGQYSVIVSGGCGNVTSSNALLTVNSGTAISTQPVASTLCAGNTVNFSVTASGTGTLSYQWKKDGTNVGSNSASLSIANTQSANAGTYTVDVTGSCGTVTSNNALLTVNPLTSISTQPVITTPCMGQTASIAVTASGTTPLSYQWKYGGVNIPGATASTYSISNASSSNDGSYLVSVTGGCGSVNSNAVVLAVEALPVVTANATPTVVCPGETLTLTGGGAGIGANYIWNNGVTDNVSFSPSSSSTYSVTGTSASGCSASTNITVNLSNITTQSTPVNGDVIWHGRTSSDYSAASNWSAYNGTNYTQATNAPSSLTNVIIPQNQTCVTAQPTLTLSGTVNAKDIVIESGATFSLGSGILNVHGNYVNNNVLNAGTGTIAFVGSGNQTITKTGGETFTNMVVNKSSGNVILANNVTVSGGLTLTNGLIEVGTNDLVMGGATLTGGSSASYVKTASTGVLSRNVSSSATTFPVGNSAYNPAMVTNAGTADIFTLRVIDNVTANGTGVGAPTTDAVVNRTWMVNEATTGGSNVTLRLYWNGAGEQINSFDPAQGFIAHYIASAGMWDNIGFSAVGTGYFETNNITSFSPFTISSSNTFAPLPIELVAFQANCAGDNKINVTWTTASEHNTSHYIVEHSRNGNDWEQIAMLAAAGNSTSLLDYTYVHENPNAGTNYYRLTQYDNDGVFEQFNAVAVDCDNMNNTTTLSTYPNPSAGSFYVSLFTEEMEGAGVLTITDSRGSVVHTQDVNIQNGNSIFNMENLNVAPGMYYIQITNGSKATDIVKHSLR